MYMLGREREKEGKCIRCKRHELFTSERSLRAAMAAI